MLLKLLMVAFILTLTGCVSVNLNLPPEKVTVYERYPVYQVAPQPVLEDLTGNEITPFIRAVDYAKTELAPKMSASEKIKFEKLLNEGVEIRKRAVDKQLDNANALIKWGKKNQMTLETYNGYAKSKNKRIQHSEVASSP